MQPDYFETNWLSIKESLYDQCEKTVNEKLVEIDRLISRIREDSSSDSKSSMGDKYETSKAMTHLELEKVWLIRSDTINLDKVMHGLIISKKFNTVQSGSIVVTSLGNYFISAALGRLNVDSREYLAISPIAPLAKFMMGRKAGETVSFNEREIAIIHVV